MNSIKVESKNFLSSRDASRVSGYDPDYIGQLCRGGRLECKRAGRIWFVNEDSLTRHCQAKGNDKPFKVEKSTSAISFSVETKEVKMAETSSVAEVKNNVNQQPDDFLNQELVKSKTGISHSQQIHQDGINSRKFPRLKQAIYSTAIHAGKYFSDKGLVMPTRDFLHKTLTMVTAIAIVFGAYYFQDSGYVESGVKVLTNTVHRTENYIVEISKLSPSQIKAGFSDVGESIVDLGSQKITTAEKSLTNFYSATIERIRLVSLTIHFAKAELVGNPIGFFRQTGENIRENIENISLTTNGIVSSVVTEGLSSTGNSIKNVAAAIIGDPLLPAKTIAKGVNYTLNNWLDAGRKLVISLFTVPDDSEIVLRVPPKSDSANPNALSGHLVVEGPRTIVQTVTERVAYPSVSREEIDNMLSALNNSLRQEIYKLTGSVNGNTVYVNNVYNAVAQTNKIDQLTNTTINNPTINDGTWNGGSISASSGGFSGNVTIDGVLSVGSSATSTFSGDVAFDTDTLYIDSINHRVGIGTTSPLTDLDIFGDVILSGAGNYINFGDVSGSSGYGLRDNGGAIEFKNSGGSWVGIGTGGGSGSASDVWSFGNGYIYNATTTDQVLMGANSTTSTAKLEVWGDIFSADKLVANYVISTSSSTSTFGGGIEVGTKIATPYFIATSTATSSLPRLLSTGIATDWLCLGGTCNSSWPASASSTLLGDNNIFSGTNIFSVLRLSGTPSSLLASFDASGNLTSTSSPQVAYINATSTTATSTFAGGLTAGNNAAFVVNQAAPANSLTIKTSEGFVGLGTASPGYPLTISAYDNTIGFHPFGYTYIDSELPSGAQLSYSGNFGIYNPSKTTGDKFAVTYHNGNDGSDVYRSALEIANTASGWGNLLLMKSGGKVGIVNSSPSYTLDVTGNAHFSSLVDASHFVATSSTASSFPYASSTALTVSGALYNTSLSTGGVAVSSSGLLYSYATSTWTFASSTLLADSNTFSGNNTFSNPITGSITGNAGTVTNGVYTTDTGTVTNTMLAGAIANDKLANSSLTVNGTTISLGGSGTITAASSTLLANDNTWSGTNAFGTLTASSFNLGVGLAHMLASFDASGNLTSTSSPQVAYINATSTTATSTFAGGLSVAGTSGLTVLQNGNVGIGTVEPEALLHVYSSASISPLIETSSANANAGIHFRGAGSGADWYIITNRSSLNGTVSSLGFYQLGDSQSSMVVNGTGNIGIGTTSPNAKLNVYSGSAGGVVPTLTSGISIEDDVDTGLTFLTPDNRTSFIVFGNNSDSIASQFAWEPTNDLLSLGTANSGADMRFLTGNYTEAVRILDNGNVGIGTTTPYAKLSVEHLSTTGTIIGTDALTGFTGNLLDLKVASTTKFSIDQSGAITSAGFSGAGGVGVNSSGLLYSYATSTWTFASSTILSDSNTWTGANIFSTLRLSGTPSSMLASFDASGNLTTTSTPQVAYINATSTTATSTFAGGLQAGGSSGLYVLQNGNVGIGTAGPDGSLHISRGNSGATANAVYELIVEDDTTAGIQILTPNSSSGSIYFGDPEDNDVGGVLYSHSSDSLSFKINGLNDRMTINSSGDVGIGTTSPWGKLSVTNTGTTPSFIVEDSTSPDTTPFIIDASGNVGIGVASPGALLDVAGNLMLSSGSASWQSPATNPIIYRSSSDSGSFTRAGDLVLEPRSASSIHFGSNGSQIMSLKNTGNIGIGTTTPEARLDIKGGALVVDGTDNMYGGLKIDTDTSGDYHVNFRSGRLSATNNGGFRWFTGARPSSGGSWSTGTEVMYLTNAGNLGIGTTSPLARLDIAETNNNTTKPIFQVSNVSSWATTTSFIVDAGGNVGIGTTTPSTGLDVFDAAADPSLSADNGMLTIGSTNISLQMGGMLSSPYTLWFQGKNRRNNGSTYPIALNPLGGNVGIGTTSPYAKLSVVGEAVAEYFTATSTSATSTLPRLASTGMATDWLCLGGDCQSSWPAGGGGGGGVGWATTTVDNESIYFYGTNYIGIGTTTPQAKLDIAGTLGSQVDLFNVSSTTATDVVSSLFKVQANGNIGIGTTSPWGQLSVNPNGITSPAFVVGSSTATNFIVMNSGNVGIGTAAPTAGLDVQIGSTGYIASFGGTGSTASLEIKNSSAVSGRGAALLINGYTSGSSKIQFEENAAARWQITADYADSDKLKFGAPTSATPWMTLTTTGNVGIGTTSPYAKLSVAGEIVADNFTATSTTATSTFAGGLNVGSGALNYDYYSGITSISALQTGNLNFETNAGLVSWADLSVTSDAPSGTEEGYAAQINGNTILQIYAQSNGSGGINYAKAVVGTSTSAVLGSSNIPWNSFIVSDGALCVDDGSGNTCATSARSRGYIYAEGNSVAGLDVAEQYRTNDATLEPGDVLMADPANPKFVLRYSVTASSSPAIVGVVSTAPGLTLGGFSDDDPLIKKVPVALSGRVPVKVDLSGGPIFIGDRLAPSDVSGYAKKATVAGYTVGIALENYDYTSISDQITVFVDKQYYLADTLSSLAERVTGISLDLASTTSSIDSQPSVDFSNYVLRANYDEQVATILNSINDQNGQLVDIHSELQAISSSTKEFLTLINATSTDVVTDDIRSKSFAANIFQIIIGQITEWLSSAVNGIHDIYATIFHAEEVHTDKLCVSDSTGETCLSKTQLDSLIAGAAAANQASGGSPDANGGSSGVTADSGPTILVQGDNPANVEIGATYIDLGVIAKDSSGHDLSVRYFVDGAQVEQISIDTSTSTVYTIDYSVTDQNGLMATSTRMVIIGATLQDTTLSLPLATTTPPVITMATTTSPLATTTDPIILPIDSTSTTETSLGSDTDILLEAIATSTTQAN